MNFMKRLEFKPSNGKRVEFDITPSGVYPKPLIFVVFINIHNHVTLRLFGSR